MTAQPLTDAERLAEIENGFDYAMLGNSDACWAKVNYDIEWLIAQLKAAQARIAELEKEVDSWRTDEGWEPKYTHDPS